MGRVDNQSQAQRRHENGNKQPGQSLLEVGGQKIHGADFLRVINSTGNRKLLPRQISGSLAKAIALFSLWFCASSATAANAPAPATSTSLRETQAVHLRIATIAFRLQTANAVICHDIYPLNGLTVRVLNADASPASRAAHLEALGMDGQPTAYLVVPGSAADKAGLVAGDQIIAVDGVAADAQPPAESPFRRAWETGERAGTLKLKVQNHAAPARVITLGSVEGCNALFDYVPRNVANAETFGNRINLFKGLIDLTRNDDELAVVMAHELAHALLHHAYPGNEAAMLNKKKRAVIEQDADRLGLLLMANAGFDPTVAGPWKLYSDARSRGFFQNVFGGYGAYMPTGERVRFLDEQSRKLAGLPRPIRPDVLGLVLP